MSWVPVTAADIASRYGTLTDGEEAIIGALIDDASDMVEEELEALGITGPPSDMARWSSTYIRVVSQIVIRVLNNPKGFLSEAVTIDDYRREYRRDSAVSTGALSITAQEILALTPRTRRRSSAFTITPG